eukprot:7310392-Ditylum_brightwellii.AAC.1
MSQTEAQEADTNETLNDPIGLSIDVRDGDINMRQSMNLSSHTLWQVSSKVTRKRTRSPRKMLQELQSQA